MGLSEILVMIAVIAGAITIFAQWSEEQSFRRIHQEQMESYVSVFNDLAEFMLMQSKRKETPVELSYDHNFDYKEAQNESDILSSSPS